MENAEKALKRNNTTTLHTDFNKTFGTLSKQLWLESRLALKNGEDVHLTTELFRSEATTILAEEIKEWGLTMEDAITKHNGDLDSYVREIL